MAGEQTSGRGRRGRDWTSARGNLFASLLVTDPGPKDRIFQLPFAAALALAQAIDTATGAHRLARLKWPNDLLVGGAKISGILVESEATGEGRQTVVLGFGVNCVSHPQEPLYPCTDLAALGYRVSPENLLEALSAALYEQLQVWRAPDGFLPLREAWLERAAHLGQKITIRGAQGDVMGTFLDLNEFGHLVIGLAEGERRTIVAGDVV